MTNMRVHLIVALTDDTQHPVLSIEDGWDEYARDANRPDFNAAMQRAADDFGWRYVREAILDVDVDKGMFERVQPSVEAAAGVHLIWRIEDGELELVTAWDDDSIAGNPARYRKDVTADRRVSVHRIDEAKLLAAFGPVVL